MKNRKKLIITRKGLEEETVLSMTSGSSNSPTWRSNDLTTKVLFDVITLFWKHSQLRTKQNQDKSKSVPAVSLLPVPRLIRNSQKANLGHREETADRQNRS